jgi:hypothetical protein
MVAHASNPSYFGGRGRRILSWRLVSATKIKTKGLKWYSTCLLASLKPWVPSPVLQKKKKKSNEQKLVAMGEKPVRYSGRL